MQKILLALAAALVAIITAIVIMTHSGPTKPPAAQQLIPPATTDGLTPYKNTSPVETTNPFGNATMTKPGANAQ